MAHVHARGACSVNVLPICRSAASSDRSLGRTSDTRTVSLTHWSTTDCMLKSSVLPRICSTDGTLCHPDWSRKLLTGAPVPRHVGVFQRAWYHERTIEGAGQEEGVGQCTELVAPAAVRHVAEQPRAFVPKGRCVRAQGAVLAADVRLQRLVGRVRLQRWVCEVARARGLAVTPCHCSTVCAQKPQGA
eukprot:scaffold17546_cov69-Phaeocystis_antarctica.AAC.3